MLAGWCRNVDSLTGEKDMRRRSGSNGSKEGHDRDKRERVCIIVYSKDLKKSF